MERAILFLCVSVLFAVNAATSLDLDLDVAVENEKDEISSTSSNFNDTEQNSSPDLSFISSLAREILEKHGNFQMVENFFKSHAPPSLNPSTSRVWTVEFDRALTSALYNNSIQNVPATLNFIMSLPTEKKNSGVRMLDELRYQMSENDHLDTPEHVSLAKVLYFYSNLHQFQSPSIITGLATVEEMELVWLIKVLPEGVKKLVWSKSVLMENRQFSNYKLRVQVNEKSGLFDIRPIVSLTLKTMNNSKNKSILYPGVNETVGNMKKVQKMDQRFWEISPVESGQFFVLRDRKMGKILNVEGENQCKSTDEICYRLKIINGTDSLSLSQQWKIVDDNVDAVQIMDK